MSVSAKRGLEWDQERRVAPTGGGRFRPVHYFRSEHPLSAKPRGRRIPILELSTNDLRRILAAAELIQSSVATIQPGEFRQLEIP